MVTNTAIADINSNIV